MEKLIGIALQKGEFNGIKYSNYILNCQYEPLDKGFGTCVHQYKVKEKYFNDIILKTFGKQEDYSKLVGLCINNPYDDIYYDQVKAIKFIKLYQVK